MDSNMKVALVSFYLLGLILLIYLLKSISLFEIFDKVGEKKRKAFVPLYDFYILCKCSKKIQWFKKYVILFLSLIVLTFAFDLLKLINSSSDLFFLNYIPCILCVLVYFIFHIPVNIALARAFRHKAMFGFGMTFLPMIFFPIVAFSNNTFVGFDSLSYRRR